MKHLLALQTEDIPDQQLEDLIQYVITLKGKNETSICPHDIKNRPSNGEYALVYYDKCLHMHTYDILASLYSEYKVVTAKDVYSFFGELVNGDFKYY